MTHPTGPYVQITVANEDGNISALEILSYDDGTPKGGREVIAPAYQAPNFVNDCMGWSEPAITYDDGICVDKAERFDQGYSVVLQIRSSDWAAWLDQFEVADLDDETAALLCEA